MDSDAVNSINDTVESAQVATLIRTAYYDFVTRADLPEHYALFTLDSSGDSTKPTVMTLPSDVEKLCWIKYNKETSADPDMDYEELFALPKEDFLARMFRLKESDSNVGTFLYTVRGVSTNFLYMNDRAPSFYSVFDDHAIFFDSYDSSVDTTLQTSKSLAYGKKLVAWTAEDSFVPDMDDNQFPLFINECKALAWAELKQTSHAKAEVNARRGWTNLQRNKEGVKVKSEFDKFPYYGRK